MSHRQRHKALRWPPELRQALPAPRFVVPAMLRYGVQRVCSKCHGARTYAMLNLSNLSLPSNYQNDLSGVMGTLPVLNLSRLDLLSAAFDDVVSLALSL